MERRFGVRLAGDIRGTWKLPPLILHPFAGDQGSDKLLEGSRANLALHGFLPDGTKTHEELMRLMLKGRYQEMRMLFYIGKDVQRWTEQCLDFVSRDAQLKDAGIREQSFVSLLIEHPPLNMTAKLTKWNVGDQKSLFSRAIGLNMLFVQLPELDCLSATFVQHYHRFADYLYIAYQTMAPYKGLTPERFQFELYASQEYANMLAHGWELG